ncbi:MAG TPA: beta-ketoacyl-[acyl-carrier-protein] synthase family protein [Phycisphaerae bacterium]|nr:beta-ketoacyl-[acyl-carrier-protein] synthase family protein [Phycisphaerae bacterium]
MSTTVLVTGVGTISPAGRTALRTWSLLLSNATCIRLLSLEPSSVNGHYNTGKASSGSSLLLAAGVASLDGSCEAAGSDRVTRFALAAAGEAVRSAGLQPAELAGPAADRCRVSIGTSKGGVITFSGVLDSLASGRISASRLAGLTDIPPDAAARAVADRYGITGGVHATVGACATGTLAILQAARWIEDGDADIVLAGSSDASIMLLWFAAFERMGVLAPAHPTLGPGFACRPFDQTRQGFVIGEGAAVLVLESAESAHRRGACPLARIAGYAAGSDPAGLAQPTPDAEPVAAVIRKALDRARIGPAQLAAVFAHGTGTPTNDLVETTALRHALGQYVTRIPIVSAKGAIGHLLGGAGSVETALAVLATRERNCPGTVTLLEPDSAFADLCLPRQSFKLGPGAILKVSMGFGGHLGAIVLVPA